MADGLACNARARFVRPTCLCLMIGRCAFDMGSTNGVVLDVGPMQARCCVMCAFDEYLTHGSMFDVRLNLVRGALDVDSMLVRPAALRVMLCICAMMCVRCSRDARSTSGSGPDVGSMRAVRARPTAPCSMRVRRAPYVCLMLAQR